jgi:hypothetical protein
MGKKLITRIIKIALNLKEDLISAVIVSRYNFFLEDAMVNFAVAERQFLFLHNIFYYDKNIIIDYLDDKRNTKGMKTLNFYTIIDKVTRLCNNS